MFDYSQHTLSRLGLIIWSVKFIKLNIYDNINTFFHRKNYRSSQNTTQRYPIFHS